MLRKASIHIKEDDLLVILDQIKGIEGLEYDSNRLAKHLLRLSKGKSATNRTIVVTQERIEKKVDKILKAGMGDSILFNNILTIIRKTKLKHRGFVKLAEGHKDWGMIKELTSLALNFCNDFQLTKKDGFRTFIELGISKMNKYSLMGFKGVSESIGVSYDAQLRIEDDEHKPDTEFAHKTYMQIIIEKSGDMGYDYRKQPEKYVFFIEVVDIAKEMGCKIDDYIKAQFHGLEWTKGIPDPVQLVGPKARERYVKYAYEFDIKTEAKKKIQNVDWKKIRKYGKSSD